MFLSLLYLIAFMEFSYSIKDAILHKMEVLTGETVYLPCNVTTYIGDDIVLILWYREDKGTPIYSVDIREGISKAVKRWSDETVFGDRAYFIFDKEPGRLSIQNVQYKDMGVYRCRVDFMKAQTRNSKIKLTVIAPPEHIVIRDDSNIERSTVVGPYNEGDIISLKCEAIGGKPIPKLIWYRDGLPFASETESMKDDNVVESKITLGPLGRSDLNSRLTCRATNHPRAATVEAVVQIDMNFPPLNIRLLGAHQPLSAGRRYDLLCQTAGSRPPAIITWWQNGIRLEKTTETTSSDGNQTTSTLSIILSKSDSGKYLSCKAYNHALPSEILEDGWRLDIQYVPEAYVRLGTSLDSNSIREGTDVYFDCLVIAHPIVYRIEWRQNNVPLSHNISNGVIVSNHSLVLQSVTRATAGNYSCVGYNAEGEGSSVPFTLNVLYAPTCTPNQPRIYGVAKQEDAKIKCMVDANPQDVEFSWTFNNSAESIDVATNHIDVSGTISTVTYTPITELDYGTLLCTAINKIGKQKNPCVFHIIAAGRPDQVHNCTLINISMTSLTVTCSDGFNGGLPQLFILELKDLNSNEIKANITSTVPRFTISSLSPGNVYEISISAFNNKGKSDPTVLTAAMLRMPEKQLTSERVENPRDEVLFSPMMSLTVGLTLAILVAGFAVILALRIPCKSSQRRRKEFSGPNDLRDGSPSPSDKSTGSKDLDGNESDDRNPDVVPEAIDSDDNSDYVKRRQHISTIDATCSPTRGLLSNTPPPQKLNAYGVTLHSTQNIEYCTLRNKMQASTSGTVLPMNVAPHIYSNSIAQCTLPRHSTQHNIWPTYSGAIAGVRQMQPISSFQKIPAHGTIRPFTHIQHTDNSEQTANTSAVCVASHIASFNNVHNPYINQNQRRKIMAATSANGANNTELGCASDDEITVQTPLVIKRESHV